MHANYTHIVNILGIQKCILQPPTLLKTKNIVLFIVKLGGSYIQIKKRE